MGPVNPNVKNMGATSAKNAPYTPLAIANNFIEKYGSQNDIEHMKLQKLIYFAYGHWLVTTSSRLTTEGPEIWKHGPAFESMYKVFRPFGSASIREPQSDSPFSEPVNVASDDEEVQQLVDWIWNRYGHLSGFALSSMAHAEGTAWQRFAQVNGYRVPPNTEIPNGYIYAAFSKLFNDSPSQRGLVEA